MRERPPFEPSPLAFIASAATPVLVGTMGVLSGSPGLNAALAVSGVFALVSALIVLITGRTAPVLPLATLPFAYAFYAQESAEGRLPPTYPWAWNVVLALPALVLLSPSPARPWRLLVTGLLVLLALFSARTGGAATMTPWFLGWVPGPWIGPVVIGIRKAIHSTFYPLLGFAMLKCAERVGWKRPPAAAFALGFIAMFAIFDEVRQSTVPGRTGSAWDVGLDLLATSLLLGALLHRGRAKCHQNEVS